jgi:hypothetical protein
MIVSCGSEVTAFEPMSPSIGESRTGCLDFRTSSEAAPRCHSLRSLSAVASPDVRSLLAAARCGKERRRNSRVLIYRSAAPIFMTEGREPVNIRCDAGAWPG